MEQNNINRSVEEAKIKLNEMKEKAVALFDEMQHNWNDLDDKIKNLVFVLVVIVLWELIKDIMDTTAFFLVVGGVVTAVILTTLWSAATVLVDQDLRSIVNIYIYFSSYQNQQILSIIK